MTIIAHELRKARKPHRCIWCGQAIAVSETYRYQRLIFEGAPQSNHWHPECFDSVDWREYEDGFTAFDGERPQSSAGGEHS